MEYDINKVSQLGLVEFFKRLQFYFFIRIGVVYDFWYWGFLLCSWFFSSQINLVNDI